MGDVDPKKIIPDNNEGFETNTESEKQSESREEAIQLYQAARQRLMQPDKWHKYAGQATADFELTGAKGEPVTGDVQVGYHLKINIPGPGSGTGNGFDWVRVEKIDEANDDDEDFTAIRVRPATNPLNQKEDVAHFFKDDATSSFIVRRAGNKVIAGIYSRNEKPNTDASAFIDKARNAVVASGAITGYSKFQWKSLVDGLIHFEGA